MTQQAPGYEQAMMEVVLWMAARGYATGHGDNIDALLVELEGQAKERALNGEEQKR